MAAEKSFMRRTIFPIVDELISLGGKYFGYTPIFQGDNAGPHEEVQYLTFVREYCANKGWYWEP
jgi:hypothetical protein